MATARNNVERSKDATAHAEIQCLRSAASMLNSWRLTGCTLYSTLEPCAMCMGAIQAFRIKRVVYGAPDHRIGAVGSWVDLVAANHPIHRVTITRGVLEEDSAILMKRFFQMRRREKKLAPIIEDRGMNYDCTI